MIEAIQLTKDFGALRALDGVSFRVERGRTAGFLGANGAGKTTTMRILTGVFPPTAGTARIAGFDLREQSREARRRLGYFAENAPFYADATVDGFLEFVARMKGIPPADRRRSRRAVIDACGLVAVAARAIGTLSKGFRQRVGLAQALLGDPEVLILDEPTVGLDPEQVAEIRALIRTLQGKRTVLLSSHVLSEVSQLCEEVIVLHRGRVLAQDSPQRLAERFRSSVRLVVRADAPAEALKTLLATLAGVESVRADGETLVVDAREPAVAAEISRVLAARNWPLLEMKHEVLGLEEVFLSLLHADGGATPAS